MCKLPEKGQQALKLYVPFNIKEVKRELIFLSPLHCIKKNTHPCKTLSLRVQKTGNALRVLRHRGCNLSASQPLVRSEEHTSELQSRPRLVCRLLLEKKNGAA